MKRIAIFLIIPFGMLCGAASVELRTGELLKLNCTAIIGELDSWTLLQNTTTDIVTYKPSLKGYACAGLFLAPDNKTSCRSGVSINVVNGKEITVSSVNYGDAGTYTCESHGQSQSESTDVVVLDSNGPTLQYDLQNVNTSTQPANNEVYQGDRLNFNCTIPFGGSKSPVMELVIRGYTGAERVLKTSNSINVPFSLNQPAVVTVDYEVSRSDRDFTIICRLPSFNTSSMRQTVNFNTIYGPILRNDTQKTTVILSNGFAVLNCSVDSYPAATFTWSRLQDGRNTSIPGSSDFNRLTETGVFQCTATNVRNYNAKVTKEFTVEAEPSKEKATMDDETLAAIIGAVVGGVVLIVVIIIVVICCVRRRRRSNDNGDNGSSKGPEYGMQDKPDAERSEET